jgi:PPOX class probable F420-dependent enzyme
MINWQDELGQRTYRRIQSEPVIWLTTISPGGFPQPRPVWFVWDGEALVIYSSAQAKKLTHITHNPNVAVPFNTDAEGYDIQVILGQAHIDSRLPPADSNSRYLEKYGDAIQLLEMSAAEYASIFRVGLRIVPVRLRGLEPIPEG